MQQAKKPKGINVRGSSKPPRANKYRNVKFVNEFGTWDSKKEYERFLVLKQAEAKGWITNLRRQVTYELIPSVIEIYIEHLKTKDVQRQRTLQRAITYTADFVYDKYGEEVVEDVKASEYLLPKEFVLKSKIFFWKYEKKIKLVYKATDEI